MTDQSIELQKSAPIHLASVASGRRVRDSSIKGKIPETGNCRASPDQSVSGNIETAKGTK
jgi:hypothetical protein